MGCMSMTLGHSNWTICSPWNWHFKNRIPLYWQATCSISLSCIQIGRLRDGIFTSSRLWLPHLRLCQKTLEGLQVGHGPAGIAQRAETCYTACKKTVDSSSDSPFRGLLRAEQGSGNGESTVFLHYGATCCIVFRYFGIYYVTQVNDYIFGLGQVIPPLLWLRLVCSLL